MPHSNNKDIVPAWGDSKKAAGTFGGIAKSQETIIADVNSIPLIDISLIFSPHLKDRQEVAAELREACVKIGFFYVTGHGIPQQQIDGVFECGRQFFDLSFEEKMEIFINNTHNYRGYTPLGGSGKRGLDGKGNINEAFDWGHDSKLNDDPVDECMDPYMKGDNVWPRQLPDFEVKLSEYYRSLRTFGRIMARNIALSLGLDEGHFENLVTHPGCSALVAHYPPVQKGILNNGLDPHTDAELFTILAAGDIRALEVLNRDGYWISAPPKKGCFIVNVGDQLQRMTNNLYVSTLHRVINYSGQERYSVPFFFSANWEAIIEPIPELLKDGGRVEPLNVTAGQMYKDTMVGIHLIAESDPDLIPYIKEIRGGRRT